jgi:hypothetical protein
MSKPTLETIETLAKSIAKLIEDYRSGEIPRTTAADVLSWAQCFEEADRLVLLKETNAILSARYTSRADADDFLRKMLVGLAKNLSGGSVEELLGITQFLQLQEPGKSQGAMLLLLNDILREYGTTVRKCGGKSPRHYVYLDDVLCTGNTLYYDMKRWWEEPNKDGVPRSDRFDADQKVHYVFLATHSVQHSKVYYRFKKTGTMNRIAPQRIWSGISVKNDPTDSDAALDFAFPRVADLSEEALEYLSELDVEPKDVCRPTGRPKKESLFTSPEERNRFERLLVTKGLELLESVSTKKANIRPLGFTLPSHKNLGFGALVFTWRNVPNNAPLAFWYDAPGFTPLFKKR